MEKEKLSTWNNHHRLIMYISLMILGFQIPVSLKSQQEHFKLLGQWSIEDDEYGLTPYCFEITMDQYGKMYAKVPATYSISRKVVTGWQKTSVVVLNNKGGYHFEPVNTRQEASYGVNFRTSSGSNEYRSICLLINYDVGENSMTGWISYKYGTFLDHVYEVGDVLFVKVGDVEKPQLIDDKQTRKRGDAGLVGNPIDLGLSVKWASWNVGASKPEDYGGYYAWGETEEKENYDWDTYKYINKNLDNDMYWDDDSNEWVYKYQRIGKRVDNDSSIVEYSICGTTYDVAHVKWGGNWRMPTLDEISELENKCKKERSSLNGVEGWYFTGPNGNKIFMPSAGYRDAWTSNGAFYNMKDWRGAACMYWSGDLITRYYLLGIRLEMADGSGAWSINFDNRGVPFGNFFSRCTGLTVRAVTK